MPGPFFDRLRAYYQHVAEVLRGEASAAAIFPNATDIGTSRERVYAEFLRQHAPSKCRVVYGGYLFDEDGNESGQLDVLVTTDTTPRFDLHNRDGNGKTFAPVEGTLAVASIKSKLDKKELQDALRGMANIPATRSVHGRINPMLRIKDYADWPYKIIYANDGISVDALWDHLVEFYGENRGIPTYRRPHVIHVAGKYALFRRVQGMAVWRPYFRVQNGAAIGEFIKITRDSDLQAIVWVLNEIQRIASTSTHILYKYESIISRLVNAPRELPD